MKTFIENYLYFLTRLCFFIHDVDRIKSYFFYLFAIMLFLLNNNYTQFHFLGEFTSAHLPYPIILCT